MTAGWKWYEKPLSHGRDGPMGGHKKPLPCVAVSCTNDATPGRRTCDVHEPSLGYRAWRSMQKASR